MAQHNELGLKGEEEAVRYLKSKGYRIRNRNWKFHGYEIDIVAENEEFIVFVEVKTRTTALFGNPEDFVGNARMRRMVDAADHYLIENAIDKPARFDIIGLIWDGNRFVEQEHIDDAFLPFL
ncbi:MAG: YraN family protein [Bacteroidia bacterium]|nr:YraN family protein [Bacteroidia bacterium]